MAEALFKAGPFAGVSVHDAFAVAALKETPVIVSLPPLSFPAALAPTPRKFGTYRAGVKIIDALTETADVLIILYTDNEVRALLEVFTGNSIWTAARKRSWYPYAHNFDAVKATIRGVNDNDALRDGIFGYLFALTIGTVRVVLYKTELHPKTNGPGLPFIPVIKQLVGELAPKLVISTGTAGAIGGNLNCGDVAITAAARLHCKNKYPLFPDLTAMSLAHTELKNSVPVDTTYIDYAAANFTKLSLPGLAQCYGRLSASPDYPFLRPNNVAPAIYLTGVSPAPGPEPMDIVSADYLTVDDNNNSEQLQTLGIMNDTDDAFAFYAIGTLPSGQRPHWLSIRNASEPQVTAPAFPPGTSPTQIIDKLKSTAGAIYGVYQYCTTLNSAFACWAVAAGMN